MTNSSTPSTLKRLITTSVVYIAFAIVAGILGISRNLPAEPMGEGSGTGRPVLQEFLLGNGTAISPGLSWLALQAVLTFIAGRRDRWGTTSVVLLAFHALLSGIFATTEPTFRRVFTPATFDPLLMVVELANVVLPCLVVTFAVLEWLRRRRTV